MFNRLKDFFFKKPRSKTIFVQTNIVDDLIRQGFDLYEKGDDAKASVIFKKILSINPFHADALYLLGMIANKYGDSVRAIELIKKAIASKDDEAFFHRSLGDIYLSHQNFVDASLCYECALKIEPDSVVTLLALGSSYESLRRFNDAENVFNHVISVDSSNFQAYTKRGEVYLDIGKADQAIADIKKAHTLRPSEQSIYSSYLFATNYSTQLSAKEIFSEHKKFDELYGYGRFGKLNCYVRDTVHTRKLRIGYVSPDFRLHAVSCFFEPVLTHHDRSNFEIFCYHLHQVKDEVSLRLKSIADHWVECSHLSDEALFEKIREDQIDILIDLAGHTSYSRLLVFARKPAPIQVTWLGYINTSGLSAIDYRIVDYYSDPVDIADQYHSEKLLRLPNSQWCYSKLDQSIDVSPLPMATSGLITFGSFNRFSKLSEKILTLWAKVLMKIKESKLHIVDVPDEQREATESFFIAHGVNLERLKLHGRLNYNDFVELHHLVDIALDAHPYSGATTTCDSLWMGVPTLTLTGETSISRSTSSIMQTLGLNDWASNTEDEFVENAIKKSSDVQKLSELRAGLRQRMQSSPLMDAALFTKNLEKAYREVWIEKCKEQNSSTENSIQ